MPQVPLSLGSAARLPRQERTLHEPATVSGGHDLNEHMVAVVDGDESRLTPRNQPS